MAPKFLNRHVLGVGVGADGTVYVTKTERYNVEEISILKSPFLHEIDMGFTSVAQKKNWIEGNYSERLAKSQRLGDFDGDGKVDAADLKIRSEQILTLQDSDGDGDFDASTVFAEGFNDTVTGVAHSVMPLGKSVYATIIPDVWKLTDTTGDGRRGPEGDSRPRLRQPYRLRQSRSARPGAGARRQDLLEHGRSRD